MKRRRPQILCQWFLKCENLATTQISHSILGQVPTCQRCADKNARIAAETRGDTR